MHVSMYVCVCVWAPTDFLFSFSIIFFLSPLFSPAYERLYQMFYLKKKKKERTYLKVCKFSQATKHI